MDSRNGDKSKSDPSEAEGISKTSEANQHLENHQVNKQPGIEMNENELPDSSSGNGNNGNGTPDGKRQKPSTMSPLLGVAASPPKFLALEEIMKAANGMSNMFLAHEIAVDRDFSLEKSAQSPLRERVEGVMKEAFWDLLQSQLNESPSNFKQALVLLAEVKENLESFLLPQHTQLKQEISDILDLELVKQQAENGTLDFQRYAQYVLSVMARLCAPVRDEKVRELTQTSEVVSLFKGIMELLQLMKLDMANFTIKEIRPYIQQQSVAYEKQKFKEFLETQTRMGNTDNIKFTKQWLERNYQKLELSPELSVKQQIELVLTCAYIELLTWDKSKYGPFPETIVIDEKRFQSLEQSIRKCVLVGSTILVTLSTLGPSFQSLAEFKEALKKNLMVILDEASTEMTFQSAAIQVIEDVNKCINNRGLPTLEPEKESMLRLSVENVAKSDNRVRNVIERRILEFIEGVLSSNNATPIQIPAGLTSLQGELSAITGQFMRLVSHNRAVFGDYYAEIVQSLTGRQ